MEIQNFTNYLIYKDGRVYSKPRYRCKGGFIKAQKDKDGYLYVILYKNKIWVKPTIKAATVIN